MPPSDSAIERRAQAVDVLVGLGVERLGHVLGRHHHDEGRQRQVDEEDPAPRGRVDQPPAEERADGGRHTAQAGPGADGPRPVVGAERRLEDGQAPRCQQRTAHPLHHPGEDEEHRGGGHRAQQRTDREHDDAELEDALAAEPVAERPAEQDQRRDRQQVAVEHPLQPADPGVEVVADCRQRHVDDGRVQEGDARAEDGGRQHPAASRRRERQPGFASRGRGRGHRRSPRPVRVGATPPRPTPAARGPGGRSPSPTAWPATRRARRSARRRLGPRRGRTAARGRTRRHRRGRGPARGRR